jgi:uncharacterized protein (UPF0332 family)
MATYQSVTSEDRIDVAPHVGRARESLRAAEMLRDAGLAADCVSRAHQACVHAERALLATEKRSPPDVRAVHRLCTLHFLQNGQLPAEHGDAAERLFELRALADDQPLRPIGHDAAADAVAAAAGFVAAAEKWLAEAGYTGRP